jgi:hypothetical protein
MRNELGGGDLGRCDVKIRRNVVEMDYILGGFLL